MREPAQDSHMSCRWQHVCPSPLVPTGCHMPWMSDTELQDLMFVLLGLSLKLVQSVLATPLLLPSEWGQSLCASV
jgi:hypothetical protein